MALLDDYIKVVGMTALNHGLVTRPRLVGERVPGKSIDRLAEGRRALVSMGGGVYLVPELQDLEYGSARAALQRLDPSRSQARFDLDPLHVDGGVLSHQTAAHLWGAIDLPRDIHITVPRRRRFKGITTHTARLEPSQITIREGLPVTTVEQTTIDLGNCFMDGEHRSRWVKHCLREGLLPEERVVELLGDAADRTLCWLG